MLNLKNILHYNPKTGAFTWLRFDKYHPHLQYNEAGTVDVGRNRLGYRRIAIDKKTYLAHAAYTNARDKHHDAPRRTL